MNKIEIETERGDPKFFEKYLEGDLKINQRRVHLNNILSNPKSSES
jgi:hypothetical protein